MIKQTILILLVIFSFQCYGQKWHLNSVDKSEKYPYEYWFHFDHAEDTSSYQLIKKSGIQNSTLELFNNRGDSIDFAVIKLINIEKETERVLFYEFDKKTELSLENGKYRIEIRSTNYDNFNLEFETENDQQIKLAVNLGLAPELEVYQIDSKIELKENEILEIIECVRLNRNVSFDSCSNLKKYRIVMHI